MTRLERSSLTSIDVYAVNLRSDVDDEAGQRPSNLCCWSKLNEVNITHRSLRDGRLRSEEMPKVRLRRKFAPEGNHQGSPRWREIPTSSACPGTIRRRA